MKTFPDQGVGITYSWNLTSPQSMNLPNTQLILSPLESLRYCEMELLSSLHDVSIGAIKIIENPLNGKVSECPEKIHFTPYSSFLAGIREYDFERDASEYLKDPRVSTYSQDPIVLSRSITKGIFKRSGEKPLKKRIEDKSNIRIAEEDNRIVVYDKLCKNKKDSKVLELLDLGDETLLVVNKDVKKEVLPVLKRLIDAYGFKGDTTESYLAHSLNILEGALNTGLYVTEERYKEFCSYMRKLKAEMVKEEENRIKKEISTYLEKVDLIEETRFGIFKKDKLSSTEMEEGKDAVGLVLDAGHSGYWALRDLKKELKKLGREELAKKAGLLLSEVEEENGTKAKRKGVLKTALTIFGPVIAGLTGMAIYEFSEMIKEAYAIAPAYDFLIPVKKGPHILEGIVNDEELQDTLVTKSPDGRSLLSLCYDPDRNGFVLRGRYYSEKLQQVRDNPSIEDPYPTLNEVFSPHNVYSDHPLPDHALAILKVVRGEKDSCYRHGTGLEWEGQTNPTHVKHIDMKFPNDDWTMKPRIIDGKKCIEFEQFLPRDGYPNKGIDHIKAPGGCIFGMGVKFFTYKPNIDKTTGKQICSDEIDRSAPYPNGFDENNPNTMHRYGIQGEVPIEYRTTTTTITTASPTITLVSPTPQEVFNQAVKNFALIVKTIVEKSVPVITGVGVASGVAAAALAINESRKRKKENASG